MQVLISVEDTLRLCISGSKTGKRALSAARMRIMRPRAGRASASAYGSASSDKREPSSGTSILRGICVSPARAPRASASAPGHRTVPRVIIPVGGDGGDAVSFLMVYLARMSISRASSYTWTMPRFIPHGKGLPETAVQVVESSPSHTRRVSGSVQAIAQASVPPLTLRRCAAPYLPIWSLPCEGQRGRGGSPLPPPPGGISVSAAARGTGG